MYRMQSAADKMMLKRVLQQRLQAYYQSLAQLGMQSQQYDVLRGRIAELTELIDSFNLNQVD